tara:strand:- start:245 stop:637 length:393 start_codon:yes stop_codon:yes gene_type:complete
MKKLLGIVVLGLFLSGCDPAPKNFVGMDSSWLKPLIVLFLICALIVGIFLIWFQKANKKGNNVHDDDFTTVLSGIAFLAGPGLITAICYIVMAVSGYLILSFFFKSVLVAIAILMGIGALAVGYVQSKKK